MTYFQNTNVTDIADLIDEFRDVLTAEGWTLDLDRADTAGAAADKRVRREIVATAPGLAAGAGNAALHRICISKLGAGLTGTIVNLCGWHGQKTGSVASLSQTGTTVTVTTAAAHGLATGDLVFWNGTSNALMDFTIGGAAATPSKITVTSATVFTVTVGESQSLSATGGTWFAVYNFTGSRAGTSAEKNRLIVTDSSMDVFGYVDKFRLTGIVVQGSNFFPFYIGITGREHVQADASDVALITGGGVTGDGATPQTFTVDRTIANWYVGQRVALIAPDAATPEDISVSETALEYVTITALPSATTVTAVISANTYPDGTLVGLDPSPLIIMGNGSAATTSDIGLKTAFMAHDLDGARTRPENQLWDPEVATATGQEGATDPDSLGFYQPGRSQVQETTGAPGRVGIRYPLVGLVPWPIGTQNNQDLMRIGAPANAPATDFKIFVSQLYDTYSASWGGGAIP